VVRSLVGHSLTRTPLVCLPTVVDEGPLFREADESRAYSDSGRSRMRTHQRMRTCIEDGCDRPHKARGRCHVHYERWRDQRPDGPRCQAPDCDRPAVAFGWCMRDYQRMRINGTLERKHRWFDRQAQQAILAAVVSIRTWSSSPGKWMPSWLHGPSPSATATACPHREPRSWPSSTLRLSVTCTAVLVANPGSWSRPPATTAGSASFPSLVLPGSPPLGFSPGMEGRVGWRTIDEWAQQAPQPLWQRGFACLARG
jgi:hypothetical protein